MKIWANDTYLYFLRILLTKERLVVYQEVHYQF